MKFIDTNIFIYAHDNSDPLKAQKSRDLLIELIDTKEGCISTQIIQEFCNVSLRKSLVPLKITDVRTIVHDVLVPLLSHYPDTAFYMRVLDTFKRYSLSFYDAAVVQAAMDLNCTVLYSEDLQSSVKYGNVKVINPFL